MHRRSFTCSLVSSLFAAGHPVVLRSQEPAGGAFRISACDWSLKRPLQPAALEMARTIGLDGVQISFGAGGDRYDLRRDTSREAYLAAVEKSGVAIASVALMLLNEMPLATQAKAETLVSEAIEAVASFRREAKKRVKSIDLGQLPSVIMLACHGQSDLAAKGAPSVVAPLKRLAAKAAAAKLTLGIESRLNAEGHVRLLDEIGSPAVRVFADTATLLRETKDPPKELRGLGEKRLCGLHCREEGRLLEASAIDFKEVREALRSIHYTGWLTIESAAPSTSTLLDAYRQNAAFLRRVFA